MLFPEPAEQVGNRQELSSEREEERTFSMDPKEGTG